MKSLYKYIIILFTIQNEIKNLVQDQSSVNQENIQISQKSEKTRSNIKQIADDDGDLLNSIEKRLQAINNPLEYEGEKQFKSLGTNHKINLNLR